MTAEQIEAIETIKLNWNERDEWDDSLPQTTYMVVSKYNREQGETLGYINGDQYEALSH